MLLNLSCTRFEIYLQYYEVVTGGEKIGEWEYSDQYTDFHIVSCHNERDDSRWHVEPAVISFLPQEYVHVVVVRYQSGCTFGTTHGNWHIQGVFQYLHEAQAVEESINNDTISGWKPWKGYFERLESVDIVTLKVED